MVGMVWYGWYVPKRIRATEDWRWAVAGQWCGGRRGDNNSERDNQDQSSNKKQNKNKKN